MTATQPSGQSTGAIMTAQLRLSPGNRIDGTPPMDHGSILGDTSCTMADIGRTLRKEVLYLGQTCRNRHPQFSCRGMKQDHLTNQIHVAKTSK